MPLASRTMLRPIRLKPVFSRFLRWPSFGGFSASMLSVRPSAAWMMAASLEPLEPKPMFSPAEDHLTPWAVKRSPRPLSPGHWCSRPQPLIMSWLCLAEALARLVSRVSAERPASARAALMCLRTASRIVSPVFGTVAGAFVAGFVVFLGAALVWRAAGAFARVDDGTDAGPAGSAATGGEEA